jgi:hypothetical protein
MGLGGTKPSGAPAGGGSAGFVAVPGRGRCDLALGHESKRWQSEHAYSPKAPHFPPRVFHVGRNFFTRVSQFTSKFHFI